MVDNHYRWDFIGLSTDEKPTPETSEKVANGSTFYCSDNSKLYVWYNTQWYEKVIEGGGGGTSYTAGDGINISNNEISVDTDTIQPKLTAGTNITIDANNVISAEGGGGATVVQTIGTSTTDVMSQKAVTDTLFHENNATRIQIGRNASSTGGSYYPSVAIGSGARASGGDTVVIGGGSASGSHSIALGDGQAYNQGSIAIGYASEARGDGSISIGGYSGSGNEAYANGKGSIAIGVGAQTTTAGEVNIGDRNGTHGYNTSNYRLLTGLYDGQSAHDAVTVEQVNATIDAINTALSTSIPHIGA